MKDCAQHAKVLEAEHLFFSIAKKAISPRTTIANLRDPKRHITAHAFILACAFILVHAFIKKGPFGP